jgi:hypothetical protein
MTYAAFSLVLLAATVGTASAAESPFVGTWQLNVEKSKLAGDTFTYTATATGFQYSNGSTIKFNFATDGKDYPAFPGETVSWTKSGDNTWDSVYKDDHGTVLSKVHRVLSPDGKTMTVTSTDYRADGTTTQDTSVRARVSGGPGLVGTWKEVKVSPAANTTIISVPSAGHIKYEFPRDKQFVEGLVDGTPSRFQGQSVPEGATVAFKQKASNELEWSYAVKGKVIEQGADTVSSDGRSRTSVSWAPGKESEKTIEVYDKQ